VHLTVLTPSGASDIDWRERLNVLHTALGKVGVAVDEAPWSDLTSLRGPTASLLAWGYHKQPTEWLAQLECAQAPLLNGKKTLRWNSDKAYLGDLARSARVVPTIFEDRLTPALADAAADAFRCDDLVIKPRFGASSMNVRRLKRGEVFAPLTEPVLVQPFLSSIVSEGEVSLMYFAGAFSHAVRKTPATGDYRTQSELGADISPTNVDNEMLRTAGQALAALDTLPDYARVDMIRGTDGLFAWPRWS